MPLAFAADVRVHVDDARHDRLAADVDALARRPALDRRRGPTAVMRLPSTRTVPLLDHRPVVPRVRPAMT